MPPTPSTPRERWIEAGLHSLSEGGPRAVRIEALAQALKVTKGGFYWHFDDRAALLEEMLETWESTMVDRVIERVEAEGGDGRTRLRRLFRLASSFEEIMGVELAVRDWARHDAGVGDRLRRVDDRRMAYMRSLFGSFCVDEDDVEARCMIVFALFVGSPIIHADHGRRSRSDVLALAVQWLVR